ncbi:MAG: hypothetical protein H8M99_07745 [Gloeobacteraceae cyanobacterium ES-bin-144]|nr:hypothetical protein [Verrucomicrobiales bacterium]
MKHLIFISLLGSICVANAELRMRDASTHEELSQKLRMNEQNDPMRKLTPAKGPDPLKANPPKSMLSESDVLCYNGVMTLVPKRAVLKIPNNMLDRMKYQRGAKLLSWKDFYALNRGWITTVEVSRSQAEGNAQIAEDAKKRMVDSGNLIVATYQSGPISVLPVKIPATSTAMTTRP